MYLGISSFTYGWNVGIEGSMPAKPMNEQDLVNQTLKLGLCCLQIGDNLPIHTFSDYRLKNLKENLEKHHIRFEIGARKLTEQNLETYIKLAKYFDSRLLRFVIDDGAYEPDKEEVIKIIRKYLPNLVAANITLGIENHDRFKASILAEIMEEINHKNVGICLDCVNSMGAGEGLEHIVETLAPFTVNIHIKDFKINRLSHKMGFIIDGELAGKGMTNIPWLLSKIAVFGRCKSAILEQWVSPEMNIDETILKEKNWANESIMYLKSVI